MASFKVILLLLVVVIVSLAAVADAKSRPPFFVNHARSDKSRDRAKNAINRKRAQIAKSRHRPLKK